MRTTTYAVAMGLALALPTWAMAETNRPKPRPQIVQLSAEAIRPTPAPRVGNQVTLLLLQATSFVSAAGMVTGVPLIPLPK